MSLEISFAKISDMLDIFNLSNDQEVRKNSFNQNEILLNNHEEWFEKKINDKNCFFYVARINYQFVGYIRFDKNETSDFIVTVHISKDFRNKGYGSKIIKEATAKVSKLDQCAFKAIIKEENQGSINSFMNAGYFIKEKNFIKSGSRCVILEYKDF